MRSTVKLGAAILCAVALAACTNDEDDSQYYLAMGEVVAAVNHAGLGVADGFAALSSCVTANQCAAATDMIVRELRLYIPVLEAQIQKLEELEPPAAAQGFQSAYLEGLRLRVEGGNLIVRGWESSDEVLLTLGVERFQESQAKLGDIIDELRALLEDQ